MTCHIQETKAPDAQEHPGCPGTKLLHPRRLVQGTRFVGLVDKLLLVSCRHHGPEQRELVLTSRLLLACRLPDVTGLHPGRKLGISPFGFGPGKACWM